MASNQLFLTVYGAESLPYQKKFLRKQDCYCLVEVGGHTYKSKVDSKDTTDPVWNEEVNTEVPAGAREAKITIYDRNVMAKDDVIAHAVYNFANATGKQETIELRTPEGEPGGRLKVWAKYAGSGAAAARGAAAAPAAGTGTVPAGTGVGAGAAGAAGAGAAAAGLAAGKHQGQHGHQNNSTARETGSGPAGAHTTESHVKQSSSSQDTTDTRELRGNPLNNPHSSNASGVHTFGQGAGTYKVDPATDHDYSAIKHWASAHEYTRRAEEEAARAELHAKEVTRIQTRVERLETEASEADRRYNQAMEALRVAEAAREALAAKQAGHEAAQRTVDVTLARRDAAFEEAERAYQVAKQHFAEAGRLREEAESKLRMASTMAQELNAGWAAIEALQTQHRRAAEEAHAKVALLDQHKTTLTGTTEQVRAARELIAQKEAELARAREAEAALVAELATYTDTTRAHESILPENMAVVNQHAAAIRAQQDTLVALQARIAGLENAAAMAQAQAAQRVEQAAGLKEHAEEMKFAADNETRAVEEARRHATQMAHEVEEAAAVAARNDPQAARASAHDAQQVVQSKRSEVSEWMSKLTTTHREVQLHKGKWHQYWQKAREYGDRADAEARARMETLEHDMRAELGNDAPALTEANSEDLAWRQDERTQEERGSHHVKTTTDRVGDAGAGQGAGGRGAPTQFTRVGGAEGYRPEAPGVDQSLGGAAVQTHATGAGAGPAARGTGTSPVVDQTTGGVGKAAQAPFAHRTTLEE